MGNIRDFVGHSFEQKHRRRGAPHSSEDVHVPCVFVCLSRRTRKYFQVAKDICGEALACMSWECIRFQVDVIAGDGNKACYLATPKAGGCPTYEVSLLQFWIDRMIHTANQARIKNYGKAPAVRVKHFISCSYKDLVILGENSQKSQNRHLYS